MKLVVAVNLLLAQLSHPMWVGGLKLVCHQWGHDLQASHPTWVGGLKYFDGVDFQRGGFVPPLSEGMTNLVPFTLIALRSRRSKSCTYRGAATFYDTERYAAKSKLFISPHPPNRENGMERTLAHPCRSFYLHTFLYSIQYIRPLYPSAFCS